MSIISNRVKKVKASPTLAIAAKALELAAAGRRIISLSAGEPDYDTPDYIKAAAQVAMADGYTKYTAVDGIKQLKEAVCAKFARDNQLNYKLNEVTVANGAKQIIFNGLMASINPGDEVIIPAPYWVSYLDMVMLVEGKPVIVLCSPEQGFKLTPAQLNQAITTRTKWLMLNSPSNPSGSVYSYKELQALAEVLLDHPHVWILSDDIYEHIVFTASQFYNIATVAPQLQSRMLIANGVSKSHAMTGWRIGYGAGPQELIRAMNIIQSQTTSNSSSISKYEAISALEGPNLNDKRELLEKRRNLVLSLLAPLERLEVIEPQGAFYILVFCGRLYNLKTKSGRVIASGEDFCSYLLEEFEVAVVPGSAFGVNDYFRISYATSEKQLVEACERIAQACQALR